MLSSSTCQQAVQHSYHCSGVLTSAGCSALHRGYGRTYSLRSSTCQQAVQRCCHCSVELISAGCSALYGRKSSTTFLFQITRRASRIQAVQHCCGPWMRHVDNAIPYLGPSFILCHAPEISVHTVPVCLDSFAI